MAVKRKKIVNYTVPFGMICWFYLNNPPDGWVVADGSWYNSDGSVSSPTQTSECWIPTPNLIGNYPLGAKTEIGTYVSPTLPNIKGTFLVGDGDLSPDNAYVAYTTNYYLQFTGATKSISITGTGVGGTSESISTYDKKVKVTFNAKAYNTIYQDGATVIPPSTKLLPCMKL